MSPWGWWVCLPLPAILSQPLGLMSEDRIFGTLQRRSSQSGRGTRLSCPERKALQKEGSGHGIKCCSNLREDGEWKEVPGFGIRGLWEILESLFTGNSLGCLRPTSPIPPLPASGAAAAPPRRPLTSLWAQGTVVPGRGGQSKAVFWKKHHCLVELY